MTTRFTEAAVVVGGHTPIDLAEMASHAELNERFDTKLLAALDDLPHIIDGLGPGVRMLEVDGSRLSEVTTSYFDTDDAALFRAHAQRRRRRYKVRIRHYGDPGAAMLEVKAKGNRGQTVKHWVPHGAVEHDVLDGSARQFVAGVVGEMYGFELPEPLRVRVTTRFRRIAVVDAEAGERVSIDGDVEAFVEGRPVRFSPDRIVVEAKSASIIPGIARSLRGLGLKPLPMSKYCMSLAAAEPRLPGNDWLPAMRWFADTSGVASPTTRPSAVLSDR